MIWWMWFRRGSKGSYYLTFVNHVLMEDAMTFWEIRKELEVEDVDWKSGDVRSVCSMVGTQLDNEGGEGFVY